MSQKRGDESAGKKVAQGISESLRDRLAQAVLDVVASLPDSSELVSDSPEARAHAIARRAAATAAKISGAAALVPGPLGLLTLVPDLLGVWRVQSQMVADIAGTYGKSARLTQEEMLHCLFKHMVSQSLRDMVAFARESGTLFGAPP